MKETIEPMLTDDEMKSDAMRKLEIVLETDDEKSERLAKHDLEVIKSMQTDFGPLMAAPETKEHNSYNRVWIRDNALIAIALETAGEDDTANEITEGLLLLLEKHQNKIRDLIKEGKPYAVERDASLIHPIYEINGQELNLEWGWHQNDAIGNLLQAVGLLADKQKNLISDHRKIISDLVKYLEVVEYWEKDRGMWEEVKLKQSNTILSCVAGLRAISDYVEVPQDLIDRGYEAAENLENEYKNDVYAQKKDIRENDLSRLNPFMLGEVAEPKTIELVEHVLLRDHGVIRYQGDRFMSGGNGHEAEWVLGLLMLGHAWLACDNKEKAKTYLDKVDNLRTKDGDIPEAYVYENGKYIPGKHTPLAWCHALALSLRKQLE